MDEREAFENFLQEATEQVYEIGRRLYALEAFTKELHLRCKGHDFDVMNDVAWQAMFDMRTVFVIELSGWTTAALRKGDNGFLGLLQGQYSGLVRFVRKRPKNELSHSAEVREQVHRETLERLFGQPSIRKNEPAIWKALRDRFDAGTSWVRTERDERRAHPFQRGPLPDSDLLNNEELRRAYDYVTQFMSDVRWIGDVGQWSWHDSALFPRAVAAEHVVDQTLLGFSPKPWQRETAYAAMHGAHDADPHPKRIFNREHGRRAMRLALKEEQNDDV
jgi:hypothetical protein